MKKLNMIGAATLAAVLCGTTGSALAEDNNPANFLVAFPAREAFAAELGDKRVRFFAEVLTDKVGVDVFSITRNTKFTIRAAVQCSGVTGGELNERGDSPLSAADDAHFVCPFFARGEGILGSVAIVN